MQDKLDNNFLISVCRKIMEFIRHFILKTVLHIYLLIWRLKAKYGSVARIKDNILYPRTRSNVKLPETSQSLGNEMLSRFSYSLNQNGDYEVLINAYFTMEGKFIIF